MILFVGKEGVGHYVPEVSGEEVKFTEEILHVKDIDEPILEQRYSEIIIDLRQFIDMPDKIIAEIEKLQKVVDRPFIFYALGSSSKSELISLLLQKGYYRFVTHPVPGQANRELREVLSGYATLSPDNMVSEAPITQELKKEDAEPKERIKDIGVVGCCSRIGTTTQSLQLVKYLTFKGYKACYMAMDGSDITRWADILGGVERTRDDESLSRIRIQGIDMYNDPTKIPLIKELGYDYIVYDFGAIQREGFSAIQFLDRDIRIVVSGISPVELDGMTAVFSSMLADSSIYLFSFISEDTKRSILKLQGKLAEKTFFAPYAPDAFVFTNKTASVYNDIFEAVGGAMKKKKPKKKGLFGKA